MISASGLAAGGCTARDAEPAYMATAAQACQPMPVFACADYERLFDETLTHRFTVYITQSEWDGLSQDLLDYQEIDPFMRTGNYRYADLVYEDEAGTIELDDIGIRTRGNTTRTLPEDGQGLHRAHFSLSFDETFDLQKGSAEYAARKERELFGLDKLNLKWNLWTDPGHIRELYCYALLNEAGVAAPRASLAALDFCIDGTLVHYGVYTLIEPVDKSFLTRRFGKQANDGNLYKCLWENIPATLEDGYPETEIGVKDWESGYRPAYDLKTNEEAADTADLAAFIDNINSLSDEDFAAYIARSFAVDRFLKYLAADLLVGTPDDYRTMGNNYYLYFNNAGKIELIPYDYDASLGGGWDGGPASSYEVLATEDIYTALNLNAAYMERAVAHPLSDRILAIPEYRGRYEDYLKMFIQSGLFSFEDYLAKFEALQALYDDYACSDTLDSGEGMALTNEEWFFETKTESVLSQLN
jgi:spore coat protein CotH